MDCLLNQPFVLHCIACREESPKENRRTYPGYCTRVDGQVSNEEQSGSIVWPHLSFQSAESSERRMRRRPDLSESISQVIKGIWEVGFELNRIFERTDGSIHLPLVIIAAAQISVSNSKVWTEFDCSL